MTADPAEVASSAEGGGLLVLAVSLLRLARSRCALLNLISLGAALGVMTWIFQDGNLSSVLRFTAQPMEVAMTVLMFGLGSGLAVLLDAVAVCGVLVPAAMRLLGRSAWYAPGMLRRFHDRYGLSESGPHQETPPQPTEQAASLSESTNKV